MSSDIAAHWFAWPNIALLAPVPCWRWSLPFLAYCGFFGTPEILPFAASAGLFLMSYTGIVAKHAGVPAGWDADNPGFYRLVLLGLPQQGPQQHRIH